MPFNVEALKKERDRVREGLRELEAESRQMEAKVKGLRQREVQAKRAIEALNALIEIAEGEPVPVAAENAPS